LPQTFVIPERRVSAGPGIQMEFLTMFLDSGFAPSARATE
jgi:hypothetical protein